MARTPQDLSSRVMRLILWPALGFGPSGALPSGVLFSQFLCTLPPLGGRHTCRTFSFPIPSSTEKKPRG
jgi:hypothetical protein